MAVSGSAVTLKDFLHGEIDSTAFHHADHVRIAFEMLGQHEFPEAALAYSTALKTIAARAGNAAAYHETITLAFLSLVSERINGKTYADFAAFAHDNRDLMDKSVLSRWYDAERLMSPLARATFVLPDPRGAQP